MESKFLLDYLREHCSVNHVPSETILKFRKDISAAKFLKFGKDISAVRAGVNFKFIKARTDHEEKTKKDSDAKSKKPKNDFDAKVVLKPVSTNQMWKVILEPLHREVSLLLKMNKFLNIQVGIGYSTESHGIHWKWKLTTSKRLGGEMKLTKSKTSGGDGSSKRLDGDGVSKLLGGEDGIPRFQKKTTFGWFPGIDLKFWWGAECGLPQYTGLLDPFNIIDKARLDVSLDKVEGIITIDTCQKTWKQGKKKTVKTSTT